MEEAVGIFLFTQRGGEFPWGTWTRSTLGAVLTLVGERWSSLAIFSLSLLSQDCDVGYTRTTSGLYLGTCEPCDCNGHATECDPETGNCQVQATCPPCSQGREG